ncbi:hypothetical protein EYF80_044629 [Liparis tanakae]|uniref:Uncharacterized protein n=1 Tax=Liparis tanakae TaxID=230148 RepID=A0A4Z2FVG3_9TELE|nr:hypothetical protein EYF80_044629 [Liparis tanakae]
MRRWRGDSEDDSCSFTLLMSLGWRKSNKLCPLKQLNQQDAFFFNKYRNTSDVEVQQTRLKLRILETDSEMKRTFARSQLTISRKPSAAWERRRNTSTHRRARRAHGAGPRAVRE